MDYGRPPIALRTSSVAAGAGVMSAIKTAKAMPETPTRTSSFQPAPAAGMRQPSDGSHRVVSSSLYATADGLGNAVPSPAYSNWLSELPEPMDPNERYARELKSYPTGIARSIKRKRADDDSGDERMVNPHIARLTNAFIPPARSPAAPGMATTADAAPGRPTSPPLPQYEMHGRSGHGPVQASHSYNYKRNSLPLLYESPLRRCPVGEVAWDYTVVSFSSFFLSSLFFSFSWSVLVRSP
jgi:hypothetical protein